MEQVEKLRQEDAIRLLKWIRENQDKWIEITMAMTEENALISKELKEVICALKNNGFYQLLILLIYANNDIIARALEKTILDIICESWDEGSLDNIINMLLDNMD